MPSYVIVGASKGLGYEFLRQLSTKPGNKVVGIARNKAAVQSKVDADKLNVQIIPGDMTDVASLNAAAQEIAKLTGGVVDYLIVNGAVMLEEPASMSPTDFIGKEQLWLDAMKASIDTNTTGVLFSVNAFLPYIRKSPIKKITVISSGMADTEFIKVAEVSQSVPYSISKAATNVLVAKYAVELRSEGITVLALSPGLVLTAAPSLDDLPPEARAGYDWMTNQFQKYEPGFKGPIGPAESIEKCLKVIEGVTVKDSGEFLSHLGNMRWLEG